MKLNEIVKVMAQEFGTSDVKELNKLLKAEPAVKFRIAGEVLGHFGFTGHIKSLTDEGVKVFKANKVSLIRFDDIEIFEKAKPRAERPARKKVAPQGLDKDFDGDEDEASLSGEAVFEEELRPKKLKKSKTKTVGKSGSKFIPALKK